MRDEMHVPPDDSATKYVSHLTKREFFAAAAMQGILANETSCGAVTDLARERSVLSDTLVARLAVGQADALIAELNK